MLVILICWSYIFFTSISFGYVLHRVWKIQTQNIALISFSGLFVITLSASIWAIFGRINIEFQLFFLLSNSIIWFKNFKPLTEISKSIYIDIQNLTKTTKLFLGLFSILILAQSANVPTLPDNDSYYIQTIKWLNEYGFVTGLANLHLFLGQTSAWHITQSVYNFSFLYDNFNDLNGYILLLGNFWAFQKLHSYTKNQKKIDLAFGLLPISYLILFQFISSPSPDLPIYIFSLILIDLFLNKDENKVRNHFLLMVFISLFLLFIKITASILFLFPIILLFQDYNSLKNSLPKVTILSGFVFIIWTIKNCIITGYPLYPVSTFTIFNFTHQVPKNVLDYFFSSDMMHSFYVPFGIYSEISLWYQLKLYLFHNGIEGYLALGTLLLVIITPFLIHKQTKKKQLLLVYVIFLCLLILLWMSSPQIRFYLYFVIFFGLLTIAYLIKDNLISILFFANGLLLFLLLFVPIEFSQWTNDGILAKNKTLGIHSVILPKTSHEIHFKKVQKGNLEYFTPVDTQSFWITGNGNLPCVNEEQIDYFETHFNIIPQLRTINLKDGFYSKTISSNE
jgi:hypothetical protein